MGATSDSGEIEPDASGPPRGAKRKAPRPPKAAKEQWRSSWWWELARYALVGMLIIGGLEWNARRAAPTKKGRRPAPAPAPTETDFAKAVRLLDVESQGSEAVLRAFADSPEHPLWTAEWAALTAAQRRAIAERAQGRLLKDALLAGREGATPAERAALAKSLAPEVFAAGVLGGDPAAAAALLETLLNPGPAVGAVTPPPVLDSSPGRPDTCPAGGGECGVDGGGDGGTGHDGPGRPGAKAAKRQKQAALKESKETQLAATTGMMRRLLRARFLKELLNGWWELRPGERSRGKLF